MPGGNVGAISAIPVDIFEAYIMQKLHRTNPHWNACTDESSFVLGGSIVHIPQAGNSPSVVKNRKSFPATAIQRGDSFVSYPLDVFSTDPTQITWQESNEISYDKTDSVLNDMVATLVEAVGDNLFYYWVNGLKPSGSSFVSDQIPVSNIIATSGASAAVNSSDGQTGNRKAFTYHELQLAQAVMNKQLVPKTDRYACLESYMYQQFLDSLSANQMAAFQQSADLTNGIVGKFAGFNLMERSEVLSFETTNTTVNVPGAALLPTDNLSALAWQKDCVAKAAGDIKPFQRIDDPMYYGNIFSALVKIGGRTRRQSWKGVLAISQAPSV